MTREQKPETTQRHDYGTAEQLRGIHAPGRSVPGIIALLAALLLLLLSTGCRKEPGEQELPPAKLASEDPWLLAVKEFGQARAYLGNGYLGVNASQEGLGFDREEQLPTFVSGYYVNESFAPGPAWAAPKLSIDGQSVTAAEARSYEQSFDLRRGVLVTRYVWRRKPRTEVEITLFPARHDPHLGVIQVALTPARQARVSLDAVAPTEGCAVALVDRQADGTPASFPGEIELAARQRWVLTRYVGICAVRDSADPQATARQSAEAAASAGFDAVLRQHTEAWERLWARDIVIEGDPAAQQVVNALRYYLLASVREGRADSVPPMGLSSSIYQGHIFWDADVWVFPALVAQYPELARSVVEYRYRTLPAAMENARKQGFRGADYAWESAESGKETVSGEFSRGRHVNAGVALAQWQYYLWTGDRDWLRTRGLPVLRATADYWVSRVWYNQPADRYEILDVMGPDEVRGPVDNNAWTNSMAQLNLDAAARAAEIVGGPGDPRWRAVAKKLWIPFDATEGRYVQCGAPDQRGHKQADCELLLYPRRLRMAEEVAARTFDHYKASVSQYGPAMTTSIYATIAAQLGRAEEAGKHFKESYEPFLLPPYYLYSEKRTSPRPCFVTGVAGTLQAILYGFAGMEPTEEGLRAKFLLPPGWERLQITGIQWRGETRDLDSHSPGP